MRLIDADALLKDARRLIDTYEEDGREIYTHINAVEVAAINVAPTIDAVPVVRCKDCRNRQNPEECPMCFTEVVDVVGGRMYKFTDLTHDGGYCHKGVKKDAAD